MERSRWLWLPWPTALPPIPPPHTGLPPPPNQTLPMRQWRTHEERNQERTVPDQIDLRLKLTSSCDAVESNKGVKAGSGSRQDPRPSEGHEPARSDTLPARQQLRQAARMEKTVSSKLTMSSNTRRICDCFKSANGCGPPLGGAQGGFILGGGGVCLLTGGLVLLEAGVTGGVIGL